VDITLADCNIYITLSQKLSLFSFVGVSTPGVPGPLSKLSLRVPAQMGRRKMEHKGETKEGTAAHVILRPGRMRLQ
jgi:hypothetical protein